MMNAQSAVRMMTHREYAQVPKNDVGGVFPCAWCDKKHPWGPCSPIEKQGKKFDTNKPRFDLIPPKALLEVAKVLQHGAEKYGDNNWKIVDNLYARYFAAAQRHCNSYQRGEKKDESGFQHLAHAICSLMFLLEKDLDVS